MNSGNAMNANYNQYVVHVSVLPQDYSVQGISDAIIIGDPRGGKLTYNYLGYQAGTNGSNGGRDYTVQTNYNAVSNTAQNIIAPVIRIASSWGATGSINNYYRAEERCAAYQENGYPAGRWRVPTVAEVDFLIQLSDNYHIPELFDCYRSGGTYLTYWANGPAHYAGSDYAARYNTVFVNGTGTSIGGNSFDAVVRCVYDEWFWGSAKYNSQRQEINSQSTNTTPAQQWIGYIF